MKKYVCEACGNVAPPGPCVVCGNDIGKPVGGSNADTV